MSEAAAMPIDVAPLARIFLMETRYKLVSRLRNPAFSVLSLFLPLMFFALFSAIFGNQKGVSQTEFGKYILAAYSTYAVANVMVFNFGIGIANERGQKQDLLQRATPLPPMVAAGAQVVLSLIFAFLALLILDAYAFVVGGVRIEFATWAGLTVKLLAGSLPMIGLGMAIGYSSSANTAPALTNVIYLPMAFISGIFIPFSQLPAFIQNVGKLLPLYHYGQLAWQSIGQQREGLPTSVIWLAVWTVALFGLAFRLYRLDESRKFS